MEMPAGRVGWLSEQEHCGENICGSETHVLFAEVKERATTGGSEPPLGPAA